MRTWLILTGGLIVWAVHFFGMYIIASVLPSSRASYWFSAAWTLPCIIVAVWLLVYLRRLQRSEADWRYRVGMAGAAFSLVAVLWQTLPILI